MEIKVIQKETLELLLPTFYLHICGDSANVKMYQDQVQQTYSTAYMVLGCNHCLQSQSYQM